jgi:hypothetical protein
MTPTAEPSSIDCKISLRFTTLLLRRHQPLN